MVTPSCWAAGRLKQNGVKSAGVTLSLSVTVRLPNVRRKYPASSEMWDANWCCTTAVYSQLNGRCCQPVFTSGA